MSDDGTDDARRDDDHTDADTERGDRDDGHLAGVEAGAGCTEIWEYLSEQRANREE